MWCSHVGLFPIFHNALTNWPLFIFFLISTLVWLSSVEHKTGFANHASIPYLPFTRPESPSDEPCTISKVNRLWLLAVWTFQEQSALQRQNLVTTPWFLSSSTWKLQPLNALIVPTFNTFKLFFGSISASFKLYVKISDMQWPPTGA